MTEDTLTSIIQGIPNFTGFMMAIFLAMYVIRLNHEEKKQLMQHWKDCEDDEERTKIADKKA